MVQNFKKLKAGVNKVFAQKSDYLFVIILLLISVFAYKIHNRNLTREIKKYKIIIFKNDNDVKELSFQKPPLKPVEVQGKIGRVVVEWNEKGAFRVVSSGCPGQICVNSGWIRYGSVICVPNGVVVKAITDKEEFDAISQ
ncbi:MAG: NusG domain II-containing protein [Candidatus Rifleibacteriota bacterium]